MRHDVLRQDVRSALRRTTLDPWERRVMSVGGMLTLLLFIGWVVSTR